MTPLTPELLLRAYAAGVFPMAERHDDDSLFWINPIKRGVIPLNGLHVSKSLRKTIRKGRLRVVCNRDFPGTLDGCAERRPGREETWINEEIYRLYCQLYDLGFAHSIEAWDGDELVGGLYGVALGGAFFGESMFSRQADASKVALVHLVALLRLGGFSLLDTQFVTDHLQRMGALEVSREAYLKMLASSLQVSARFDPAPPADQMELELERIFAENRKDPSAQK